jgi:hypothetical protein
MFRWFRKKYEQFKLDRSERKLNKEGKRKQDEARDKKDPALFEDWENNYAYQEYRELQWARNKLESDALLRQADELYLPRPDYNDKTKWRANDDEYYPLEGYVLTHEAMAELRATIRKDRKERREEFEWWVKIISGGLTILTGFVGALIGLAAIWKHK